MEDPIAPKSGSNGEEFVLTICQRLSGDNKTPAGRNLSAGAMIKLELLDNMLIVLVCQHKLYRTRYFFAIFSFYTVYGVFRDVDPIRVSA